MSELLEKFANLKGAKFVGINEYTNKNGEVSNQLINCNVSIYNAKRADLVTLLAFPASKLNEIAENVNATKEEALNAINELITSSKKNLSNERTPQSIAQSNAYVHIGKGLKYNKETGILYITGFAKSKTVLKKGTYKVVNSASKTLVKKEIQKTLKMYNYRNFQLSNIGDSLKITGSTIQLG